MGRNAAGPDTPGGPVLRQRIGVPKVDRMRGGIVVRFRFNSIITGNAQ